MAPQWLGSIYGKFYKFVVVFQVWNLVTGGLTWIQGHLGFGWMLW